MVDAVSEFFSSIFFPNLGIVLRNIGNHISVFGIEIKFYGIVITIGFILAYFLVVNEAKRTGQNPENYLDLMLVILIPSILGARIYYILFSLDSYIVKGDIKATILGMLNIREGGLAIYGGIIGGVIAAVIFCKVKKFHIWEMADAASFGLLVGQILGRWGNFFNREAFGRYTNSVFAMGIPLDYYRKEGSLNGLVKEGIISQEMLDNTKMIDGMDCIMVHPTFLYESLWNLAVLIFLLIYRKHKKFTGEFAFIYIAAYGLGRFIVESFRTDSLMLGNTGIRVSQLVGIVCFVVGATCLTINYIKLAGKNKARR